MARDSMNEAVEDEKPAGGEQKTSEGDEMSPAWVRFLVAYYIALPVVVLFALIKVWPQKIPVTEGLVHRVELFMGKVVFSIPHELQVILVVALCGALGSVVHGAQSLVAYIGGRRIVQSWRWWYLMRPFIGVALAVGAYLAIRAGFFATSAGTGTFNTVGFAAAAFLVGMFSRQAAQKLAEVFETLFHVQEHEYDIEYRDKLKTQGGAEGEAGPPSRD